MANKLKQIRKAAEKKYDKCEEVMLKSFNGVISLRYRNAQKEIEQLIGEFYARATVKDSVDVEYGKKLVSKEDKKAMLLFIKSKEKDLGPKFALYYNQIVSPQLTYINALKTQIGAVLAALQIYKTTITSKILKDIYKTSFKLTVDDNNSILDINVNPDMPKDEAINKTINKGWA